MATKRDPNNPASFNHRTILLNTGRTYHFVDEFNAEHFDPIETPTLLCIHGFPDFWYGWRNQIAPWCNEGWRVVVPDMLGYGDTSKPEEPNEYSTKALSDDLAALLDFIEVPKAFIIGHDWGSVIAWRFSVWHPERCKAMVNLSAAYHPPQRAYLPLEEIVKRFPGFGYQLYLADGDTTREIEQHLATFFALMFQTPTSVHRYSSMPMEGNLRALLLDKSTKVDSPWNKDMSKEEIQHYLSTFSRSGMNGPLNYYRTTRIRYDEESLHQLPAQLPQFPWMFIYGDRDRTCNQKLVEKICAFAPQIKIVKLEGKSHWVMIEAKQQVAKLILDFVRSNAEDRRARL